MKGDMPQMYAGVYGRWLIGKLENCHKDYVKGSNGYDQLRDEGNKTEA